MTAVNWLEEQLQKCMKNYYPISGLIEQAKEMEKQQIIDAYDEGQEYEYQYHINNTPKFDSQTYYAETYGSKGSDETKTIEKESYPEFPDRIWLHGDGRKLTPSQTEISDEKIEKEANYLYVIEDEIEAFIQGAKWYREQLKQRQNG